MKSVGVAVAKKLARWINLRQKYYWLMSHFFPRVLVRQQYKHFYHQRINLNNPQTIDEKINWLKFHYDLTVLTRCADKYAVRSFVEERGLAHTLNELYGVYERPQDIDYSVFPNSFVMKATHGGGGGSVLIVRDKSNLDVTATNALLDEWLKQGGGFRLYEPHYWPIPHRILVERLITSDDGMCDLVDYKIHCFDGRPYSILLCSDRFSAGHANLMTYDLQWNAHPEYVIPKKRAQRIFSKPIHFEQMMEYSAILSKGFPYVRVDWYDTAHGLVFGELTFTPAGGFMRNYTHEYLLDLGNQLQIPEGFIR